MNKEFKKLEKENEKMRVELDKLIGLNNPLYSAYWNEINKLIENEIEQEEFCNE